MQACQNHPDSVSSVAGDQLAAAQQQAGTAGQSAATAADACGANHHGACFQQGRCNILLQCGLRDRLLGPFSPPLHACLHIILTHLTPTYLHVRTSAPMQMLHSDCRCPPLFGFLPLSQHLYWGRHSSLLLCSRDRSCFPLHLCKQLIIKMQGFPHLHMRSTPTGAASTFVACRQQLGVCLCLQAQVEVQLRDSQQRVSRLQSDLARAECLLDSNAVAKMKLPLFPMSPLAAPPVGHDRAKDKENCSRPAKSNRHQVSAPWSSCRLCISWNQPSQDWPCTYLAHPELETPDSTNHYCLAIFAAIGIVCLRCKCRNEDVF